MKPRVLLVGGTDSSGGAGLSRDVVTVTRLGAEAALAVTSVTAQSDIAFNGACHLGAEHVAAQIGAAGSVGAVKTGMLVDAATVCKVAEALPDVPLVVDPVLASSSGHALLDNEGIGALLARLLPRATLVTPNLPELALLCQTLGLGQDVPLADRAQALLALGCGAVLVKGGHAKNGRICEDRLYTGPGTPPRRFRGPRFPGTMRGTGCRLASGIAASLAQGFDLPAAVVRSRALLVAEFAGLSRP
ncbi:hydroxymethylpyrimidine/phosphomethylpyrimidine kinase [Ruegeria intermedia]|uniref:hydroxymethylpyrimidine kinase n=1 Tax=Ruegeria intermedia TaxID=996115 RepID=A0A1M5BGV4_9RHOB|nr:hydroxymethylpyrimidine/phosphomethylpyrimidine kinase [Ruegeria intermedia]SHF41452.1 hydroxymethylpyrimidine/phosphomethylpyrimidine kinase [Ruegeria intermedia]